MYTSYETAAATFKKVLALDDDNQAAMFYMGRCYQRLGKNKKAKKWYEKAIAIDSSTANAVQAQQYLEEVQALLGESTESTETP
jgi:Tfp pilus assembly protein PilF